MTDARRKELYWGRYDGSGSRISGPAVSRPAGIPDGAGLPVAGQAASLYPDELGEPIWREHPSAAVLAELAAERLSVAGTGLGESGSGLSRPETGPSAPGTGLALLPPEPLYLRRPDARVPGPPKRVTSL